MIKYKKTHSHIFLNKNTTLSKIKLKYKKKHIVFYKFFSKRELSASKTRFSFLSKAEVLLIKGDSSKETVDAPSSEALFFIMRHCFFLR